MKSGEKGLIGPGSNNYGRDEKPIPVTKLTPELADKIFKSISRSKYEADISKKTVLFHLKQLKAQMGKAAKRAATQFMRQGILNCMEMIDDKISKINK